STPAIACSPAAGSRAESHDVARPLACARYHRACAVAILASALHRERAVIDAGRFLGVAIAHLVAIAGCYQPDVRDCMLQCSAPTDCTGGQICRGDGWCAMPDAPACASSSDDDDGENTAMPDARPATGDAADLCSHGCTNGTCVGGVCVI